MAILRDKTTSAPLWEATPLEVVLAAETVGRSEVVFDDVGMEFNPDATLKAYQDELAANKAIVASSKAKASDKKIAQAMIDSAPNVDASIPTIETALAEARARVVK